MKCPSCKGKGGIIDTRPTKENHTRRRYRCSKCPGRWSTLEQMVLFAKRKSRSSMGKRIVKLAQEQNNDRARAVVRAELNNIFGVDIERHHR